MTVGQRLGGGRAGEFERLDDPGTGHSALMELNYTPQNADGSISIEKAVAINEAFRFSASSGRTRSSAACCSYSAFIYQYRSAYELCLGRG